MLSLLQHWILLKRANFVKNVYFPFEFNNFSTTKKPKLQIKSLII